MITDKHFSTAVVLKWVLLPLRLFLGVTFIYAAIQKLADPQFFHAGTVGYIGTQITAFAANSPLQAFLRQFVVPHAVFFGLLVVIGELAIGLGVLLGLLFRPAVFSGIVLNTVFFLTVSWRVYPYFYGSDIVFIFCWLPLLLNGPLNTGYPTLDESLTLPLLRRMSATKGAGSVSMLYLLLGLPAPLTVSANQAVPAAENEQGGSARVVPDVHKGEGTRRVFLTGVLVGGVGTLVVAVCEHMLHFGQKAAANSAATTPAATTTIAQTESVPSNSAVRFTIPDSEHPGLLVHLDHGDFVAYDAICTHAGCEVEYNADSKLLVCPCHGAAFDPAQKAAVVRPPATKPLTPVALRIDAVTGEVMLAK